MWSEVNDEYFENTIHVPEKGLKFIGNFVYNKRINTTN